MKFKRLLSSFLCAVMLVGTLTVSASAAELKSFKDVPVDFWAHDYIMVMVDKGMFAGTTAPDKNGVGTFSPNTPMTRAAFITVVTRYLYADELNVMSAGEKWYSNFYNIALEKELIKKNYLPESGLGEAMTRQEMAYVLANALEELGQTPEQVIPDSRIPDYSSIGTAYRKYVKVAYTEGLIAGTDAKGTFNPMGTLTRAQAATVIYRLVEESTRNPIKVDTDLQVGQDNGVRVDASTSWVEGQSHSMNDIAVGAVVTAKDGTKVTLKAGWGGVVGAGQGVDVWSGATSPVTGFVAKEGVIGPDSSMFRRSQINNELFTADMWKEIYFASKPANNAVGDYEGEVYNTYWVWKSQNLTYKEQLHADSYNGGRGVWVYKGGDIA